MHHPGPLRSQRPSAWAWARPFLAEHADDLIFRPGRIGQRPEQIENGARAELAAHLCDMAHGGVMDRREHKAEPASPRCTGDGLGLQSILTPSACNTSAEPEREEIERLPCLATGTPAPATTKAAQVEILCVPLPSPPVPQVSMAPSGARTLTARCAHGARGAGDFLDGLATGAQRHQQRADLHVGSRRPT